MTISSRFAVAVHTLTLLDAAAGEPVSSERIAASASTNAAVIRRILCMLSRAGLTTSQLGAGGGALLARPADRVTLLEIYRAVEDGELFAMHHEAPDPRCPVGRHIQTALERATEEARRSMEAVLGAHTVADVLDDVTTLVEREAVSLRSR
jgi:Rrf2 family protein